VVLADGRILECDERHDPDLFWALRGAGGGILGVVTSLVVGTVPAPPATGFHLVWPHTAAASVIEAWQAWAPDELAASLLVKAGCDADRPPVVNVFGAMLGAEPATVELLDELVASAGHDPTSTDRVHASYREIKRYLVDLGDQMEGGVSHGSPMEPGPVYSRSEFFRRPLPAGAIAALVDNLVSGRMPGESRALDSTRGPAPTTWFRNMRRPCPSCRAVPAQARARPRPRARRP